MYGHSNSTVIDAGYVRLLDYLRRSSETQQRITPQTLQASISNYLVSPPSHLASATPLVATVVSSQLWHPLSYASLSALALTFQHAIQAKHECLTKTPRGLFNLEIPTRTLAQWITSILWGLRHADSLVKLSVTAGLILGLHNLPDKYKDTRKRTLEKSHIVALAEVLEEGPSSAGSILNGRVKLSLLMASQSFPVISDDIVGKSRQSDAVSCCLLLVRSAFQSGQFALQLAASTSQDGAGQFVIEPFIRRDLDLLVSTDEFRLIGPLSKLISKLLATPSVEPSQGRVRETWVLLDQANATFANIASNLQHAWTLAMIAEIGDENRIEQQSRESAKQLWIIFKTFLFCSLMVSQTILSNIQFLPPSNSAQSSPIMLSKAILEHLYQMSLLISQFGGLTGTKEGSFKELRKVFYEALDVLSSDAQQSEAFVTYLVGGDNFQASGKHISTYEASRKTYALACIEQLIPVLSISCTESSVLPFVQPYLDDSSHLETFESAHSVLLAILETSADPSRDRGFIRFLIPGYANCLLKNAVENKLNTIQLRLAYSSLVRAAKVLGDSVDIQDGEALEWLCVAKLLSAVRGISGDHTETDTSEEAQAKLRFMLIALTSSVSVNLLPEVLQETERMIVAMGASSQRQALLNLLYEEILLRAGDTEKEYLARWWHDLIGRFRFGAASLTRQQESSENQ